MKSASMCARKRSRAALLALCLLHSLGLAAGNGMTLTASLQWYRLPFNTPPCPLPMPIADDTPFIPVQLTYVRTYGLIALGFAPLCPRQSLLPSLSNEDAVHTCLNSLTGTVALSPNLGDSYECVGVYSELARVQAAVFSTVRDNNATLVCVLGGYVGDSGAFRQTTALATASVSCSSDIYNWFEDTPLPTPIVGPTATVLDGWVYLAGGDRRDAELQNVLFRIALLENSDGSITLADDWQIVAYTSPVSNRLFPFVLGVHGAPSLVSPNGRNMSGQWLLLGAGMRNATAVSDQVNTSIVSLGSFADGRIQAFDTWTVKPSILTPLTDPRIIHVQPTELWAAYSLLSPAVPSVDRGGLVVLMRSPRYEPTSPLLLFSGSGAYLSRNLGISWSMIQHRLAGSRLSSSIVPGSRAQLWIPDQGQESLVLVVSDREKSVYRGYFVPCNDTCPPGFYFTGCMLSPYDGRCVPCSTCSPGSTYASKPCRTVHQLGWSDTVCTSCRGCSGHVVQACNNTADTLCSDSAPYEPPITPQYSWAYGYGDSFAGGLAVFVTVWAGAGATLLLYRLSTAFRSRVDTLRTLWLALLTPPDATVPDKKQRLPCMYIIANMAVWVTFVLGSMAIDTTIAGMPVIEHFRYWASALAACTLILGSVLPAVLQATRAFAVHGEKGVRHHFWLAALALITPPSLQLLLHREVCFKKTDPRVVVLVSLTLAEIGPMIINQLAFLLVLGYSTTSIAILASAAGNAIAWLTAGAAMGSLVFSLRALHVYQASWAPSPPKAVRSPQSVLPGAFDFHSTNPMHARSHEVISRANPLAVERRLGRFNAAGGPDNGSRDSISSSVDSDVTGDSKDDVWSVDLHGGENSPVPTRNRRASDEMSLENGIRDVQPPAKPAYHGLTGVQNPVANRIPQSHHILFPTGFSGYPSHMPAHPFVLRPQMPQMGGQMLGGPQRGAQQMLVGPAFVSPPALRHPMQSDESSDDDDSGGWLPQDRHADDDPN